MPAIIALTAFLGVAACGGASPGQGSPNVAPVVSAAVKSDLAPTGQLRVGLPTHPPVIASKDPASGELKGIGVDLGKELAAQLGVPFTPVLFGDFDSALAAPGTWDVVFSPLHPEMTNLQFTPEFMLLSHTYIVVAGSTFKTADDVDRPGVKIASNAAAGHTAKLAAVLKQATLVKVDTDQAGLAMLKAGVVDAFASGTFQLVDIAKQQAGYRVLDGAFFNAKIGTAVASGHSAGYDYLKAYLQKANTSGLVQQAITRTGESGLILAAAG